MNGKKLAAAVVAAILFSAPAASAGEADVVGAEAIAEGGGKYRFADSVHGYGGKEVIVPLAE